MAGMTAGSIEGAGRLLARQQEPDRRQQQPSTDVAAVIADGGVAAAPAARSPRSAPARLMLSGNNTYTGPTMVNGGTLLVNGSIASSSLTTVNAGGTLGGTAPSATPPSMAARSRPASSIGTITVQGSLAMAAAAAYLVEVTPAAADRTNVTGTASLAGTVSAVSQPARICSSNTSYCMPTAGAPAPSPPVDSPPARPRRFAPA